MKLTYIGKMAPVYNGYDDVNKVSISVKKGDVVDVSDEKGNQLLNDYPNDWSKGGSVKSTLSAPKESKPKRKYTRRKK